MIAFLHSLYWFGIAYLYWVGLVVLVAGVFALFLKILDWGSHS